MWGVNLRCYMYLSHQFSHRGFNYLKSIGASQEVFCSRNHVDGSRCSSSDSTFATSSTQARNVSNGISDPKLSGY